MTITDRGRPAARIVPLSTTQVDWDERLEQQGVIRWPKKRPEPGWLASHPLAKSRASVLGALLEERREDTR